jgi:hypothetical protein
MTKKRLSSRKIKRSKKGRLRLPSLGSLAVGGVAAAFLGFIVVLVVYGVTGGEGEGDGGRPDLDPAITETLSESEGAPFEGGASLHFPVASIDFGHVPLNANVSYAFAMTNVGDAEVEIEDVGVKILEGC